MPIGNGGIPDKVFQFSIFQVAWHHLALGERTKRGGVAYLTAEFHAGYSGLHIIWVRQKIRKNSPQSEWDRADWAPSDKYGLGFSAVRRHRTMSNRPQVSRILLYSRHSSLEPQPGKSASLGYPGVVS
jgi:hypothetical protein